MFSGLTGRLPIAGLLLPLRGYRSGSIEVNEEVGCIGRGYNLRVAWLKAEASRSSIELRG